MNDFFAASIIIIIFAIGVLLSFPMPAFVRRRLDEGRKPISAAEATKRIRDLPLILRGAASNLASAAVCLKEHRADTGRREKAGREMYAALGILRNFARTDAGADMRSDALLEQFAQTEGVLRESFATVLKLLRSGREEEAAESFARTVGTEFGRDFIMLILEWDRIPPARLSDTIESYRCAMREKRTTELMRKTETMSDLVYLPVVAGVLAVFMNFVYTAYFIEQKDMLMQIFY